MNCAILQPIHPVADRVAKQPMTRSKSYEMIQNHEGDFRSVHLLASCCQAVYKILLKWQLSTAFKNIRFIQSSANRVRVLCSYANYSRVIYRGEQTHICIMVNQYTTRLRSATFCIPDNSRDFSQLLAASSTESKSKAITSLKYFVSSRLHRMECNTT